MNNNPFLNPKEFNNRFNFLDDEDFKTSFKESNKSNRKTIEYKSSQNSFTQPEKSQQNYDNRDQRNYRKNNDYKSKLREPSHVNIIPNIDTTNTEIFPELAPIKYAKINTIQPSTKFKDMLNNVVENEKPQVNSIPSGWVQLSHVNGKTIIEYGQKTDSIIKQETFEKEYEEDPNNIMFNVIETMKQRWNEYERQYDSLHGEGAYTKRYGLPFVNNLEYESESESETEEYEEEYDGI